MPRNPNGHRAIFRVDSLEDEDNHEDFTQQLQAVPFGDASDSDGVEVLAGKSKGFRVSYKVSPSIHSCYDQL